jgi:8-oxo-dGTP pyrophosphatase MutT (NUDIX family)
VSFRDLDDFVARAQARLDAPRGAETLAETGDLDMLGEDQRFSVRPAAVLIGLIPRRDGVTALLTKRPETMARHAGQVAFPGGKIDPGDADAAAAALREAQEEVGVDPMQVELLARGAPYVTGSGFRVSPLVGLLPGDFEARPCSFEVAAVFEVPLSTLMDPASLMQSEGVWKGQKRRYYEMAFGPWRIWGVTAGIIRDLHQRVYG